MVRCKEEPFEPESTVACVNFDLLNVEKAPRKILTPPQASLLQRPVKVEPTALLRPVERPSSATNKSPVRGTKRQAQVSGSIFQHRV
jgi:hypothetical protein